MPLVTGELQSRLRDIPPAIYNAARIVSARLFSTNRPGRRVLRGACRSEDDVLGRRHRLSVTRRSDKG